MKKKNEGESNGLSGGKQNGWLFVIFMRFYSFPFFFDLLISLYLWVRIFLVYFLLLLFFFPVFSGCSDSDEALFAAFGSSCSRLGVPSFSYPP